jgi:hypothetical protein
MLAKQKATEDEMQDKFQMAINDKQIYFEERMALELKKSAISEEKIRFEGLV